MLLDQLDLLDLPVLQGLLDLPVLRDLLGLLDLPERRDPLDLPVRKDLLDLLELRDLPDHKDLLDQLVVTLPTSLSSRMVQPLYVARFSMMEQTSESEQLHLQTD